MHIRESASMSSLPFFGGVDLLEATFVTQNFSRHFHEGYAVGGITRGAMEFEYLGSKHVAPAGQVNLVVPGEAHDGHAAGDDGWSYAMFYLRPQALKEAAKAVGARGALPHFRMGVINDPALASCVLQTHRALHDEGTSSLEKETRLYWLLAHWITRHADNRGSLPPTGREHRAVRRVRDMIRDEFARDIRLDDIAALAGLSPFHLLRVFREHTGITPHALLTQTRIEQARKLLASRKRLADIAQECGFADQAHMTRQFKRQIGITPGRFRKIVQNS